MRTQKKKTPEDWRELAEKITGRELLLRCDEYFKEAEIDCWSRLLGAGCRRGVLVGAVLCYLFIGRKMRIAMRKMETERARVIKATRRMFLVKANAYRGLDLPREADECLDKIKTLDAELQSSKAALKVKHLGISGLPGNLVVIQEYARQVGVWLMPRDIAHLVSAVCNSLDPEDQWDGEDAIRKQIARFDANPKNVFCRRLLRRDFRAQLLNPLVYSTTSARLTGRQQASPHRTRKLK